MLLFLFYIQVLAYFKDNQQFLINPSNLDIY